MTSLRVSTIKVRMHQHCTPRQTAPWPTTPWSIPGMQLSWAGPTLGLMHTPRSLLGYNDCDTTKNNNAGCQVQVDKPNSYGPGLNSVGGGWYAMERTSNFINLWFWARNDPSVPADISSGASQVNPAHWGASRCCFGWPDNPH